MKSVNNRFVTANSVFVGLLAGVGESPLCRHAINTGNSVVGERSLLVFWCHSPCRSIQSTPLGLAPESTSYPTPPTQS